MTDEVITKGLDHCSSSGECKDCPANPRVGNFGYCTGLLMKAAIDLINRQKAEIERLQELVDEMGDYFPSCIDCEGKTEFGERTEKCVYLTDTENYCIKRGISNIIAIQKENSSLKEALITARAEAIKEFAERLKKHSRKMQSSDFSGEFWDRAVLVEAIDNLVKEMTEDTP